MKKAFFLLFVTFTFTMSAQQYKTAIGVKGLEYGYGRYYGHYSMGAFNVKHFIGGSSALEGSIGGGRNHLWIQVMYEKNQPIEGGLEWYWGLGGDLGFWDRHYHPVFDDYHHHDSWGGFDVVFGLEYTISDIPLNFALDLGPTIRLFPDIGFGWIGGLAIRYAIK